MSSFSVLDRCEVMHRHRLLEASAGTGKTFAIENIVVRLLMESGEQFSPLLLEKILIVTFTKAATRDLKKRIRGNLEKAVTYLKGFLHAEDAIEGVPDFLLALMELGESGVRQAIRRLEKALFCFDQAQIFTIHGFCWRMLSTYAVEAGVGLAMQTPENQSPIRTIRLRAVHNFLRAEVVEEQYSPQQLRIILDRSGKSIDQLQEELLYEVSRGVEIAPSPDFSVLFGMFCEAMGFIQLQGTFCSGSIVEDFLMCAPHYKGLCNRNKEVHEESLEKVSRFAQLFDKSVWNVEDFELLIRDGLYLLEALDPSALKQKATPPEDKQLHYPRLLQLVDEKLSGIVGQARNPTILFSRLARDCQQFLRHYQEREEISDHTDLLQQMCQAVRNEHFSGCVRGAYDAVIVDEFQDTDPLQWEIFDRLFADPKACWKGFLTLVGDPKQSIYAFRQADIYTYLSAADRLGREALLTLGTNFRSQRPLIEALNVLFTEAHALFPLPRLSDILPYREVEAGKKEEKVFHDGNPSMHFWMAQSEDIRSYSLKEYEERFFFPALAEELIRLNREERMAFSCCAVLVSDRFQSERLCRYLKRCGIPVWVQRSQDLSKSVVIGVMKELICGVMNDRDRSALHLMLGSRLIGFTHEKLLSLTEEEEADIVRRCEELKKLLMEEGFGAFYSHLMGSCWGQDGKDLLERLLGQRDGGDFYREWQDLAELLMVEQATLRCSPKELVAFLDEVEWRARAEEDKFKKYVDTTEEGVSILTIHVSKGLEFDVVFPLGLLSRPKVSEDRLILVERDGKTYLSAVAACSEGDYRRYCEELDAEKMRQLYVALTRAKYRLYIPVIAGAKHLEVKLGEASPMDLLLKKLSSPLGELVNKHATVMTMRELEEQLTAPVHVGSGDVEETLKPPKEVVVPGEMLSVQSFTSLAHAKSEVMGDQVSVAPHAFDAEKKTPHTLPSGSETGVVLHTILETISFDEVKEMDDIALFEKMIYSKVMHTPFASWSGVVARMLWQTLHAPLPGKGFCLAQVDGGKMYREVEFLYPSEGVSSDKAIVLPGFVKGVIDLCFEYEGKYYLVDWKSNWLGESEEAYCVENLEAAMQANCYDLQVELYIEALKRYIGCFDHRPFEEIFGGAYYFFLRGVGEGRGIWASKLGGDYV